jgi:arylsulfate sulfotransferase
MKIRSTLVTVIAGLFIVFSPIAGANQADDTTITITGHTAGPTPFLSRLTLHVSNTTVLKSIQFAINPKPGSFARPLSGTYANFYLMNRGLENPPEVILPVYGLYAGYANIVRLTYRFMDGSSKQAALSITTATFDDQGCGYNNPTRLQPRTNSTHLSYDYIFDSSSCGTFSPVILDSDGALRWVSPLPLGTALFAASTFFDNAVYMTQRSQLFRIELNDGSISVLADYSNIGVEHLHHNIDRGKRGLLLEPDTTSYFESEILEVDSVDGHALKMFNMANIISAAMLAGGDDPSQFVFPAPTDWFHNNGVAYNRADDSLIVSSRENFLICLDYNRAAIKWILGDTTKKWYQFPSLRKFALSVAPGSLAPIGQHSPGVTFDEGVLVFDNGQMSQFQNPPGEQRNYASPRKYSLDLVAKVATEVWNFPMNQSIHSPFCGSCYEDAPYNYLIDYAFVNGGLGGPTFAQLVGLDAAGEEIFYYQYPTMGCGTAYNSIPIHLESTKFPTVGPQALNLSTRGLVSVGDNVLIGGFIVTGPGPKSVVLRALGPSLSGFGLSGVLADPVLKVYNSSHTLIASNDDWHADIGAAYIVQNGLAPTNPSESATLQTLAPGAYTVIVTGKDPTPGISLVELYDVSPLSNSELVNMSARGSVGTGDSVLISGFIVGDVESATVVVRALGPSLASYGVSGVLGDPTLTIYDSNGTVIASNDNWQDNINAIDIRKNGLAPPNPSESALVLRLPAGVYTAIVRGANGGTGVGLAEVYTLH